MIKTLSARLSALVLCAAATSAFAQAPVTPAAQLAADNKAALARYESDKKLCDDENSSNRRLQCRRDAKQDYDTALAAAKAKAGPQLAAASAPAVAPCTGCGKVTAVSVREQDGEGGALGIIAGGVGGALLGNQVGGGTGKKVATVAGAVGGAYAGKKIEEKARAHKVWTVSVQYANGTRGSFEFDHDPGFANGDAVRNSGKTIVRR